MSSWAFLEILVLEEGEDSEVDFRIEARSVQSQREEHLTNLPLTLPSRWDSRGCMSKSPFTRDRRG